MVDVERILQIPINNQGFNDFIAWRGTKHGRYTVKSGYYIQWKHQFGPGAGQLSLPGSPAQNHVWGILWKSKVPSKVQIFYLACLTWYYPFEVHSGKSTHWGHCSLSNMCSRCGGCQASPFRVPNSQGGLANFKYSTCDR
jgi:hypothetical protein